MIGRRFPRYPELHRALDVLPGWGTVTIQLFLRELRGVRPGAQPSLDQRAAAGARHLGLAGPAPGQPGRPLPSSPPAAAWTCGTWKAGWSSWHWPTATGWTHARAGRRAPPLPRATVGSGP